MSSLAPVTGGGTPDRAAAPDEIGLGFDAIRRLLPHRDPFVLVDRVVSIEPGRRIVCLKNVSGAEPIFGAHFPTHAIFPGVLTLEVMAQATLLLFLAGPEPAMTPTEGLPVLGAARARWLTPVLPGDQLVVTVTLEKRTAIGAVVACEATVRGRLAARAGLTLGIVKAAA